LAHFIQSAQSQGINTSMLASLQTALQQLSLTGYGDKDYSCLTLSYQANTSKPAR